MSLSLLILTFTHLLWAQTAPNPSPSSAPPIDVDKVCAKARAQDAANANNPEYAQNDVSTQCAAIHASSKGSRLSNRLGKMRVVSTTTCGVATGICMIGNVNPKVKRIGKVLAKACGGMGTALGTIDTVAQGSLDSELNKETSGFDAMGLLGMGKNLYESRNSIKDMGQAFENGKSSKDAKGEEQTSCETIGKATLEETRAMATHFDTSSSLSQAKTDAENELKKNVSDGGAFANNFASSIDKDGSPQPEAKPEDEGELPSFPEDLATEFEDATGMSADDLMNSDSSPEDIATDIANALGMDGATIKNAIASAGASLPGSDAMSKSSGETDGTPDAGSVRSIASNSTFKIPDLSGLFKKNDEKSPTEKAKKYDKDYSKMTAAELEKDIKHNLFLRVSNRYEKEIPQLEKLLWSAKNNTHHNPKALDILSKRYPASKM